MGLSLGWRSSGPAQPVVDVCVAQRPSDYLISTNQPLCLRLWIAWIIPFACNRCLKPDGRDVAVASLWLHLLEFRKPNLASASVGAFVFATLHQPPRASAPFILAADALALLWPAPSPAAR